jgi:hypothetical protein
MYGLCNFVKAFNLIRFGAGVLGAHGQKSCDKRGLLERALLIFSKEAGVMGIIQKYKNVGECANLF